MTEPDLAAHPPVGDTETTEPCWDCSGPVGAHVLSTECGEQTLCQLCFEARGDSLSLCPVCSRHVAQDFVGWPNDATLPRVCWACWPNTYWACQHCEHEYEFAKELPGCDCALLCAACVSPTADPAVTNARRAKARAGRALALRTLMQQIFG
jgi:hypothetical protein